MQGAAGGQAALPLKQRTFLGHPVGLYILFFTEMWERFSYYGMRALLVLYMVNYFKWMQKDASAVYKWYTSLVYLTPLLGGYLADRYLGNKKAVIIGAVLMAIGHFLMAFEAIQVFMAALVFLIIGNGFFKPNMSTQVGRLYPAERRPPRRRLHHLLHGHQPRRLPVAAGLRLAGRQHHRRLSHRLHHGRHRHGLRPGHLRRRACAGWSSWTRARRRRTPPQPPTSRRRGGSNRRLRRGPAAVAEGRRRNGAIQAPLPEAPPAFDPSRAGLRPEHLRYDAATGMLTATAPLTDEQVSALLRGNDAGTPPDGAPMSEAQADRTPSRLPWLNWVSPGLLAVVGFVLGGGALLLALIRVWLWRRAPPFSERSRSTIGSPTTP